MVTCKDCEFGGSCVLSHKSDSQVCNIFTHKKDYVEVVRCKDCQYGEYDYTEYFDYYECRYIGGDWNKGDHFCSYGERREGE